MKARLGPLMVPVGRFTFQFRRAASTSLMPIWREASLNGSSCTRTAYFCAPSTATCATPDTIEMRCAMRVSAYSSSVQSGNVLRGERQIQNGLVGGVHLGEGGRSGHSLRQQAGGLGDGRLHVHGGSVQVAAQVELEHHLRGAERVMDVMDDSPAMVENWFSSGVATEDAIVSGLAPGRRGRNQQSG